MSHMRFRSRNHPQQTSRRGDASLFPELVDATDETDDRATPWELYRLLDNRFHFTIDVAASEHNAKCERYYDRDANGLAQSWAGERVWCNPPFSAIRPWVAKAHAEVDAELVVMLLPSNRTEQPWWQELVEPQRDRGGGAQCGVPAWAPSIHPAAWCHRVQGRPPSVRCLLAHLGGAR